MNFKDLFNINLLISELCRKNTYGESDSVNHQILMNQQFIMLMQLPEPERTRVHEWLNKSVVFNEKTNQWEKK